MNDIHVVPLTQGHFAIVDADDAPIVSTKCWQATIGNGSNAKVYAKTDRGMHGGKRSTPRSIRMHRVIANAPDGMVVDHINGNTLDNRRANLRVCTQAENLMNKSSPPTNNTSGYIGVWLDKRRGAWVAETRYHQKKVHIGQFASKVEAAVARDRKVKELYGDKAFLNFPDLARSGDG